jgi:hypothetical protein
MGGPLASHYYTVMEGNHIPSDNISLTASLIAAGIGLTMCFWPRLVNGIRALRLRRRRERGAGTGA